MIILFCLVSLLLLSKLAAFGVLYTSLIPFICIFWPDYIFFIRMTVSTLSTTRLVRSLVDLLGSTVDTVFLDLGIILLLNV